MYEYPIMLKGIKHACHFTYAYLAARWTLFLIQRSQDNPEKAFLLGGISLILAYSFFSLLAGATYSFGWLIRSEKGFLRSVGPYRLTRKILRWVICIFWGFWIGFAFLWQVPYTFKHACFTGFIGFCCIKIILFFRSLDDLQWGEPISIINPTTGLPLIGGKGGTDTAGHRYGEE